MRRVFTRAAETWAAGLIAGLAFLAVWSVLDDRMRALWPASRWLHVQSIHVYDAWQGETPYMHVVRDIRRPFAGEWTASVIEVQSLAGLESCPAASGRTAYRTDARLPPELTLSWWRDGKPCDLPPGRYRLVTEWRIITQGWPEKVLRTESNIFEVHPHWRDRN